jgi:hypothetical protein
MVTSKVEHSLAIQLVGTKVTVVITAEGGDPALARDFADQIANRVEKKLQRMTTHGGEDPNEAHGRVLSFTQ